MAILLLSMILKHIFRKANLLILSGVCAATHTVQAQQSTDTLDVCRIEFGSSESPATNKKQKASMVAYCHREHLFATQTAYDQKKTSWLVWYEAERLMKIEDKQGIPLNYRKQLRNNVYLEGTPIDTAIDNQLANTHSNSDWDNENEYLIPGYGVLTPTEDTITIEGYSCRKAVIQYHQDAGCKEGMIHRVEIWYTLDLPRYYLPPFSFLQNIPGAMLMIAMQDTDGGTTYLRATSIIKERKDISFFKPSKDIQILYPPRLR